MYSFLVYGSKHKQKDTEVFGRALDVTRRLMPSLGCSLGVCRRELPEINGGWFYFYPEEVSEGRLVSEFVEENAAVLVFGSMVRQGLVGAAEVVAGAWKEGGVDVVRNLDGCFGAVIVDLVERTVHVVSDLMGLRTLTYFANDEVLLVSPHDVPIVATGMCPVEYDLEAAASIVACDWSLGGESLLRDLKVCDPNTYVKWKEGKLEVVHKPAILPEGRIEAGDRKGIDAHIDVMIEKMREDAKFLCSDAPEVKVELTAGMDSRMVTAVLLSVLESSRICAVTGGGENNYEVKAAKRMAEKYGFCHRRFTPGEEAGDSFLPLSRLLAFVTNGTTNSKRAVFSMPRVDVVSNPAFVGNGGEIYAGFYTPSPLQRPRLSEYTSDDVLRYLVRSLPGMGKMEWCDGGMKEKLLGRLVCSVEELERISSTPGDVLSLFYLYERYCRWGSGTARRTFVRNRYSLFNSPALVKLAYRLPSPIQQNCLFHRTVIKRYMPEAYRWFVNRTKYMPIFDHARAAKAFSEVLIRANRVRDAVGDRLSRGGKSFEKGAGDVFAARLGDVLRDMLLSEDSLSMRILRRESVERILAEHISGRENHIHTIGWLATLEQWKKLISEAAAAAGE